MGGEHAHPPSEGRRHIKKENLNGFDLILEDSEKLGTVVILICDNTGVIFDDIPLIRGASAVVCNFSVAIITRAEILHIPD